MHFSLAQAGGLFVLAVQASPAPSASGASPGVIPPGNPPEPINPYPNTGNLTAPEPMPYMPAGGVNVNRTDIPVYQAFSDFDWFSLALALHQEYIELDLFNYGLQKFPVKEFEKAGLTQADRDLIQFMGNQEIGSLICRLYGLHH